MILFFCTNSTDLKSNFANDSKSIRLNFFTYITKYIKKNNIFVSILSFLKNKFGNNITNGYSCSYPPINPKKSFTLIELSVIVVIISLMLSVVLVSKSLINSTKINKIYEEYRMYNNSIQLFYDRYGCMPGDCASQQIVDISTNISSVCLTPATTAAFAANIQAYNTVGSGLIESTTKRTCMFQQLQASGFISNQINFNYNTGSSPLSDSIARQTIPTAAFSKNAAWDFRHVSVNLTWLQIETVVNRWAIPMEIGLSPMNAWVNNHFLLLRNANTATGLINDMSVSSGGLYGSDGPQYALTSNLTQKLDSKFDDGTPYGGSIAGGLTIAQINANGNYNTVANSATCSTLSGGVFLITSSTSPMSSATYLSSNDVSKGCLVAFLVVNPT